MEPWTWRWMGAAALEPRTAYTSSGELIQIRDPRARDAALTFLGRSLVRAHGIPWRKGDRGRARLETMARTMNAAMGLRRDVLAFVDDGRPVTFASHLEASSDTDRMLGVGGREVAVDVPAALSRVPMRALAALDFPDMVSVLGMSFWMALASREAQGVQWAQARGWLPIDPEGMDPRAREAAGWMEEAIRDGRSPSAEAWAWEQSGALLRATQRVPRLALRPRRDRTPVPAPAPPVPARPCRWMETESLEDWYADRYQADVDEGPEPTHGQLLQVGADMARSHPDPNWGYPEGAASPLDWRVANTVAARIWEHLRARSLSRRQPPPGSLPATVSGEIVIDTAYARIAYAHPAGTPGSGATAVRLGAHFGAHLAQIMRVRALQAAQLEGRLPADPALLPTFWRRAHDWRLEMIEGRTGPDSAIEHLAWTVSAAVSEGYLQEMALQNRNFETRGAMLDDGSFDQHGF